MTGTTTASLDRLREKLRAALLSGTPTEQIRVRLADAERDAVAKAGEQATRDAAIAGADAARITETGHAMTGQVLAGLRAALADLPLPPAIEGHMDVPAIHHAAIADAADAVARAAAEERRLHDELQTADAPRLLAQQRLRDKAAERAAIGARRAAGNATPEDPGMLLAIQLDVEGLQTVLAETQAAALPLRERAMQATRATADARHRLAAAEAAAREAILVEHAHACETALLAVVHRLDAVRVGPRPVWGASVALRNALRDLAARRGEL